MGVIVATSHGATRAHTTCVRRREFRSLGLREPGNRNAIHVGSGRAHPVGHSASLPCGPAGSFRTRRDHRCVRAPRRRHAARGERAIGDPPDLSSPRRYSFQVRDMIDHIDTESLVVVVDDDEWICRALHRVLTTAGYRARTFTSARAYLAEQDAMEPACLILDIMILDLDGLTTLSESRSTGAEIPAIFITGTADLDAGVKAMKTGAFDLLEKPLDEVVLLAAIENALHHGQEQRKSRERLALMWRAAETMTAREAQV